MFGHDFHLGQQRGSPAMMPFGGALIQLKSATELRQPVDRPKAYSAASTKQAQVKIG
jgi:hypothetical protein